MRTSSPSAAGADRARRSSTKSSTSVCSSIGSASVASRSAIDSVARPLFGATQHPCVEEGQPWLSARRVPMFAAIHALDALITSP